MCDLIPMQRSRGLNIRCFGLDGHGSIFYRRPRPRPRLSRCPCLKNILFISARADIGGTPAAVPSGIEAERFESDAQIPVQRHAAPTFPEDFWCCRMPGPRRSDARLPTNEPESDFYGLFPVLPPEL